MLIETKEVCLRVSCFPPDPERPTKHLYSDETGKDNPWHPLAFRNVKASLTHSGRAPAVQVTRAIQTTKKHPIC